MLNDIIESNGSVNQTNGKPHPLTSPDAPPPDSNLELGTLHFELHHTRNGKIARLPHDLREQLNRSLRNGAQYSTLIAILAEKGYPGISVSSISSWRHGGYVDWLQQQQRIETRFDSHQALERCTRAARFQGPQQNAIALAADHLVRIMLQFDPNRALQILYRKPELFPSFVAAIASLARSSSHLAKALETVQTHENSIREKLPNSDPVGPSESLSLGPIRTDSDLLGPIRTDSDQK